MRKLTLCVLGAITALALTAPSAAAQGEVTVTGGDQQILLSSGNHNQFYPIHKEGVPPQTTADVTYCATEWDARYYESGADDFGEVVSFDTWYSQYGHEYNAQCDSYWRPCNTYAGGTEANWGMDIYATGLPAPATEFRVDLDLCMRYYWVDYTGTVTADLVMSGSTVTALKFNEAYLQNQSPAPGTGGVAVAVGLDGEVNVDTPLQVEHTEQ